MRAGKGDYLGLKIMLGLYLFLPAMAVVWPQDCRHQQLHGTDSCNAKSAIVYAQARAPQGGDGGGGGRGGNQIIQCYNCILGGPAGGAGGNGGSASGLGSQPLKSSTPGATLSSAILASCTLRIAGKLEVDAKNCFYEKLDRKFSIVAGSENRKYIYKMSVALNDDKTGNGTLSGGKTPEIRNLGIMTRERACWVSLDKSVELCAWK